MAVSSRRKLLLFSTQYPPNVTGGAELIVQTLAEELAGRGLDVVVVSLSMQDRDSIDYVNGLQVYRVSIENIYPFGVPRPGFVRRAIWHCKDVNNLAMARKVEKILDDERPDWVSTHNLSGFSVSVWGAIKRRNIGLSHTLHDLYLLCPNTIMYKNGRRCESQCAVCSMLSSSKKRASRGIDVVIGVSRFVLDRHLQSGYFCSAAPVVIYNGRPWREPQLSHVVTRSKRLRLGFMGRLHASKGPETLLRAVAGLPEGTWELRIAGREQYPGYVKLLQQRYPLPNVDYLGWVDPEEFYPSVDVLIVPSESPEGLPNVAVEALGFGLRVVAADVGGLPELLSGCDAGVLYRVGDADDLRRKLDALVNSPPAGEEVRQAALMRRAYFTPGRMADEFLAAIHLS